MTISRPRCAPQQRTNTLSCSWIAKHQSISLHGSICDHETGGNDPIEQMTTKRNSWSNAWKVGALPTEPLCEGSSATVFARTPCPHWTTLRHAISRPFKRLLSTRHGIVGVREGTRRGDAPLSCLPNWIQQSSEDTCRTSCVCVRCLYQDCNPKISFRSRKAIMCRMICDSAMSSLQNTRFRLDATQDRNASYLPLSTTIFSIWNWPRAVAMLKKSPGSPLPTARAMWPAS